MPEHWKVDRLKWTIESCKNGVWGNEPEGTDADIICIRVADFDRTTFRVNIGVPTLRAVTATERAGRTLANGDLLLEKSGGGDLQPVGAVVIYDHAEPAVCSNFVARMPVMASHSSRYFTYCHAFLYASRVNTCSIKQTTGIQNLDAYSYLDEAIGHPLLDEQRAIAMFLDHETARIDGLVAKVRYSIEKLQEFRIALVSAAVTGKIDVRNKLEGDCHDYTTLCE